ncbi:MAG: DUF370 domain-containing protein [Clostridia bacterium]|nr:DUF370 domain-containing protein [Clostridia bacterium]MBO5291502.1 DUF370 domain-containing protein [Clostridia bacterium]
MYMHLGENTVVRLDEIIGIFDMDNTTVSKSTREFLKFSEKRREVINVSYELPKSFIVCSNKKKENRVYISQISSTTLNKRSGFIDRL